jgi:alpha-tubulin suppressor-like RCC1 family protein
LYLAGEGILKECWKATVLSTESQINCLSLSANIGLKNIALGKQHCILQSNTNTVWAVGYSDAGQLGISQLEIAKAQVTTIHI